MTCLNPLVLLLGAVVATATAPVPAVTGNEPVIVSCEGCEAVFQGFPARLQHHVRLLPEAAPGEPLLLDGTVYNAAGAPQPDVVLYAYHTDHLGIYPPAPELAAGTAAARHGRLRGWVRTDAQGRYQLHTIRPASYPESTVEQHIHMHVIEPGRCTYYLGDVLFEDDPRLLPRQRQRQLEAPGGNGIVVPRGDARNGWQATRDIHLGLNVQNYQRCDD